MLDYEIRPLKPDELYLLEEFIYEAIFQRDQKNLLPRSIVEQPDMKVYTEGFGKADDYCLLAIANGNPVGAVWVRILDGSVKGFGNIDSSTPEFAISLYKEYRGKGIGTQLMRRMLDHLKKEGYEKTSLAVQKDNYAARMYLNLGFEIVDENEEEYIMVHCLGTERNENS